MAWSWQEVKLFKLHFDLLLKQSMSPCDTLQFKATSTDRIIPIMIYFLWEVISPDA
jgi:hypothetical protein